MGNNSSAVTALRVVSVSPGSPGSELEIFFDYILAVNNERCLQSGDFADKIFESENTEISLSVFSSRTGIFRIVSVVPRRWNGHGLLGAGVIEEVIGEEGGLQVVNIRKGSVADKVGLVPFMDWVIAWDGGLLKNLNDLDEVIERESEICFWVYNKNGDIRRVEFNEPFGCEFAVGAIHDIPLKLDNIDINMILPKQDEYLSGMRILRVLPNGPMAAFDIELFFSLIQSVDGKNLTSPDEFSEIVRSGKDSILKLGIVNLRTSEKVEISVTPKEWEGTGLLGAVVKWVCPISENTYLRVLSVSGNSPASVAGLTPLTDYIVGCEDDAIYDMGRIVENAISESKSVRFTIFDALTLTVRDVELKPGWAGEGNLGCHLASGAFHKLPAISRIKSIKHQSPTVSSVTTAPPSPRPTE